MEKTVTPADIVIISQAMYKAISQSELPRPGGIAIKGKYIIFVGENHELLPYIGDNTMVYNCDENSLLMPGFCDAHLHLSMTIAAENGPQLRFVQSETECVSVVEKWYQKNPHVPWILGFGWHFSNWEHKTLPTKKLLSQTFPHIPVCLIDVDVHGAWVNQKALDIMGINAHTPNPEGGIIHKDALGEPTGYLEESPTLTAYDLASQALDKDPETRKNNLYNTCLKLNRRGITSVMDAADTEAPWYDTIETLKEKNNLHLRINTTVCMNDNEAFLEDGLKLAQKYPNKADLVYFWGYKLLSDGVGGIRTAWMTDGYADAPDIKGYPLMPEEKMREYILKTQKAGFGVHIHACGTRAVEFALDTFEEAEKQGLIKGQRNSITHCDSINDKDFPRFGQQNITAALQPDMLAPTYSWKDNLYPSRFGEKLMENSWANKRIFDNTKVVSFSSDSPVTVANPMNGIFRATQRIHDDGLPKGGIFPEEKVTLSQCLWAYTFGGAYQLGKEDILGSLEIGKLADITVLDKNLFTSNPEDYRKTEAKLTIMQGKVVYEVNSI